MRKEIGKIGLRPVEVELLLEVELLVNNIQNK